MTRHEFILHPILRLNGFQRLLQIRRIGIERLGIGVIHQLGIVTEITGSVQMRLQFVDRHTKLRIIHQSCLLIEIQVKLSDILLRIKQSATKQLPSADNLHAPATGADKGQQRLRHHRRPLTDGHSLLVARQIVHFEQHQTRITLSHTLTVTVLQLRGETHTRQFVGIVLRTIHATILQT